MEQTGWKLGESAVPILAPLPAVIDSAKIDHDLKWLFNGVRSSVEMHWSGHDALWMIRFQWKTCSCQVSRGQCDCPHQQLNINIQATTDRLRHRSGLSALNTVKEQCPCSNNVGIFLDVFTCLPWNALYSLCTNCWMLILKPIWKATCGYDRDLTHWSWSARLWQRVDNRVWLAGAVLLL